MSDEPSIPPRLAAARRKWNMFAQVSLGLLALILLAFLALLVTACFSSKPLQVGPTTLIGPKCTSMALIHQPSPGAGAEIFVYESGAAARPSYVVDIRAVQWPSQHGTPLPTVRGKHLWRLGPFALVLR